jgi:hypothetical protein
MKVGGKLHPLVGGGIAARRLGALGIGHWALVTLPHASCLIPHPQKLHPLVGGVFLCLILRTEVLSARRCANTTKRSATANKKNLGDKPRRRGRG